MTAIAEQLAKRLDDVSYSDEHHSCDLYDAAAAELRRLAPMEAERENLKQSLAAANAMHHDEQLHSAQISKGLDKALARVKVLEDAGRLCRHHMYAHASNTPDGAFDALCLALDKN